MEEQDNFFETYQNDRKWNSEQFKSVLIEIANGKEYQRDELPDEIDLSDGVIGASIDSIASMPKNKETFTYAKIDSQRKKVLVYSGDPIVGNEEEVFSQFKVNTQLNAEKNAVESTEPIAYTVHTHPGEQFSFPPSPKDISNLLSKKNGSMMFVISGETRYLIVRHSETQSLDSNQITDLVTKWDQQIVDLLESKMDSIDKVGLTNFEEYQDSEDMINQTIQSNLFYDYCNQLGLEVYVATDNNVYTRENAVENDQKYRL